MDGNGKMLSQKETRLFCESKSSYSGFEVVCEHALYCYLHDGHHRLNHVNMIWGNIINKIIKKGFKQIIVVCGSCHIPDMKGGALNTKGLESLLPKDVCKLTLCVTPAPLKQEAAFIKEYVYRSPTNYNSCGVFNYYISLRKMLPASKSVVAMGLNRTTVGGK